MPHEAGQLCHYAFFVEHAGRSRLRLAEARVAVIVGCLTFMDMGLDLPITKLLAGDHASNTVEAENSRWIFSET